MKIRITYIEDYGKGRTVTWEQKDWEKKKNWEKGRGTLGTLVAEALDKTGKIEVELLRDI